MRKYLKPALEMDAFDLRDVLTASDDYEDMGGGTPGTGEQTGDNGATAPIALDFN